MDESHGQGSSNTPAPFLTKTYEMVDDSMTNSLVSWSPSGCSFIVWNPPDFCKGLLPKYFKHNNFSSFVRQLNTYGFRKIDPDQWEFANEEFIRGHIHLLTNIHRRKPVHSHSTQNQGQCSIPIFSETERNEFEGKIERLKRENNLLQLELQKRESENRGFKFYVQSLHERLRYLEHRQTQLMTIFAQLLKKPGFSSALVQQSEVNNKKRRLLMPNYCGDESVMDESWSLPDKKENVHPLSIPIVDLEHIDKLETALNIWAAFLCGIGEAFSQDVYDFGVLPPVSTVTIAEEGASSEEHDVYDEPCSPISHSSSPQSMDIHSSPEMASSDNHIDGSNISLDVNARQKSSGIDVTSKTASATEDKTLKNKVLETTNISVKNGANDLFWEQFLTETPAASCNTHEIPPESGDGEIREDVSKPADDKNSWCNTNNLNNLTKEFGNLSSTV